MGGAEGGAASSHVGWRISLVFASQIVSGPRRYVGGRGGSAGASRGLACSECYTDREALVAGPPAGSPSSPGAFHDFAAKTLGIP